MGGAAWRHRGLPAVVVGRRRVAGAQPGATAEFRGARRGLAHAAVRAVARRADHRGDRPVAAALDAQALARAGSARGRDRRPRRQQRAHAAGDRGRTGCGDGDAAGGRGVVRPQFCGAGEVRSGLRIRRRAQHARAAARRLAPRRRWRRAARSGRGRARQRRGRAGDGAPGSSARTSGRHAGRARVVGAARRRRRHFLFRGRHGRGGRHQSCRARISIACRRDTSRRLGLAARRGPRLWPHRSGRRQQQRHGDRGAGATVLAGPERDWPPHQARRSDEREPVADDCRRVEGREPARHSAESDARPRHLPAVQRQARGVRGAAAHERRSVGARPAGAPT